MSEETFYEKIIRPNLEVEPLAKAHTMPSAWYHHPEMPGLELEKIFNKAWIYAGHISEIPTAGDTLHVNAGKNPIIVIREGESHFRAFYNVCKHRGGPLAVKKGTTSVLQCQYHGWTYKLSGELRGVPDWNLVELFDSAEFGLTPVTVGLWHGLLFVNISPQNLLENHLAGIDERVYPVAFENYRIRHTRQYHLKCNWKVYIDNYLEGYHIPIVHPELAKLLDYSAYKTELYPEYSLQFSPLSAEENIYTTGGGEALYYFLFPNVMLNILPGRLQTNVVHPVSVDECIVEFRYYFADDFPEEKIKKDISYSDFVQAEDAEICEAVQIGLQSGGYDKGRFSVKREAGVHHFQRLIKEKLAEN